VDKAKRTVSDHQQAYSKFCKVVSPKHITDLAGTTNDGEANKEV